AMVECARGVVAEFFFSSRRRHTRFSRDWSSDVCSSDLSDTHFDMVRVGIAMYGVSPAPALDGQAASLRPAMTLGSRVALIRRVRSEERRVGKEWRVRRPP